MKRNIDLDNFFRLAAKQPAPVDYKTLVAQIDLLENAPKQKWNLKNRWIMLSIITGIVLSTIWLSMPKDQPNQQINQPDRLPKSEGQELQQIRPLFVFEEPGIKPDSTPFIAQYTVTSDIDSIEEIVHVDTLFELEERLDSIVPQRKRQMLTMNWDRTFRFVIKQKTTRKDLKKLKEEIYERSNGEITATSIGAVFKKGNLKYLRLRLKRKSGEDCPTCGTFDIIPHLSIKECVFGWKTKKGEFDRFYREVGIEPYHMHCPPTPENIDRWKREAITIPDSIVKPGKYQIEFREEYTQAQNDSVASYAMKHGVHLKRYDRTYGKKLYEYISILNNIKPYVTGFGHLIKWRGKPQIVKWEVTADGTVPFIYAGTEGSLKEYNISKITQGMLNGNCEVPRP